MSKDKELEIQLQFLDEALEYLGTLEDALLGLANGRIDTGKINAALRAAHSIKGGAGMMGFHALSHLAHRLEDSFKVLKTQKASLEIDGELEGLLLSAVDCLRHVIGCDRHNVSLDSRWLDYHANPIFDQLYERLGDPQAEDATSVLSPEEGQDIIPLFFQTEVEGCLQRLESVLADPEMPCLYEEIAILAQELGGLGEMLQLASFTKLCESVAGYLEAAPDQTEAIARQALQAWRRSQALVLTGNLDSLPEAIQITGIEVGTAPAQPIIAEEMEALWVDQLSAEFPNEAESESLTETFSDFAADAVLEAEMDSLTESTFADPIETAGFSDPFEQNSLSQTEFDRADFAQFAQANFAQTDFDQFAPESTADLDRFEQEDFYPVEVEQVEVKQVEVEVEQVEQADFAQADFDQADFAQTDFDQASFAQTDFDQAGFAQTDSVQVDFDQAGFAQTDFDQADSEQADSEQADFAQTDFDQADFAQTDFDQAGFAQTDFDQADFDQADFDQSFAQADFDQAGFEQADFAAFNQAIADQAAFDQSFEQADFDQSSFEEAFNNAGNGLTAADESVQLPFMQTESIPSQLDQAQSIQPTQPTQPTQPIQPNRPTQSSPEVQPVQPRVEQAQFSQPQSDSTQFTTQPTRTQPTRLEPVRTQPVQPQITQPQPIQSQSPSSRPPLRQPRSAESVVEPKTQVVRPRPTASEPEARPMNFRALEAKADTTPPPIRESQENTVRVPLKQLNQLNDLFGELTIERNGLDMHMKRMRALVRTLSHRVQVLEQSNAQLRTAYDKVATQAIASEAAPSLVGANSWAKQNGYSDLDNYLSNSGLSNSGDGSFREEGDRHESTDSSDINSNFDVLEMDRYSDLHLLSQEVMETIVQIQEVTSDIELGLEDTEQTTRELNKTSRQLQTSLTQVRMRPLSDVVDRFPRALRELSLQYGKQVELKLQGSSTLIDRNILEALNDPLMHLLRNAFDHGIEDPETRKRHGKSEQGIIEITAAHRSNRTIITISDDGGGIPLDKIRARARQMGLDPMLLAAASDEELLSLIFEPGFSTTDRVTALSGRGVGMDVVRDNLKQVRGEITVNTQANVGTTFTLSVPFTLSVARVLLAESNGMLLAFPTDAVEEMLALQSEQVISAAGSEAFEWQGSMVQLIRLFRWLEFRCPRQISRLEAPPTINSPTILMVSQGSQIIGIQVDRCWGEQEVAIRQVEGNLPMPSGFTNCTILGDGRVVPLVNIPELLHWITSYERSSIVPVAEPTFQQPVPPSSPNLFTSQPSYPSAYPQSYTPSHFPSQLPAAPTQPAYPPSQLPAAPVQPVQSPAPISAPAQPSYPAAQRPAYPVSALSSNYAALTEPALPIPTAPSMPPSKPTILIVDDSINVRRFLALTLEKAGYRVEQAKDGQDALEKLAAGLQVQAVICDIEMPRLDGYGFLAKVKANPACDRIPIAMLTSRSGDKHRQLAMSLGATAYFSKPYNEQALLRTLEQLINTPTAQR
ncbi:response regulator [Leptolyngbya sp. FACHB-541]|uniref:response regulator n=1 Tax=Leptolyngbya sp. FACHB-541 TaxID=2692810 RepID=UPI001F550F07|nr:response regulator [Leptolyngbya sp. FACHB-541]